MLISFFNAFLIVLVTFLAYKYFSLKEMLGPLENRYSLLLEGVSTVVDKVEGYDGRHSVKIAALALRIGERMGLKSDELQVLYAASLLHDIGEVLLPKEMFKSDSAYGPEESDLLHSHTIIGEFHLKSRFRYGDEVPAVVRWHHERWDGLGYPDNLFGSEIPLNARILAVADTVSAMTRERKHLNKKVFSVEQIREEILVNSGSQFDPDVVAGFLALGEKAIEDIFFSKGWNEDKCNG